METVEAYLDRKLREAELLNSCLSSPFDLQRPASAAAAIVQKFRIAAAIKVEQAMRSWAVTETARSPAQPASAGAFEFRYGYQRADLRAYGPEVYPSLCAPTSPALQQTIYTSSGMSALAALLTTLSRLNKSVEMLVPRGYYSETRELIESLGAGISAHPWESVCGTRRSRGTARILLLDSSVPAAFFSFLRMPVRDIDLVVFDTTCYWRSSARIRRAARWALQSGLPVALVRSHAKLDCLGIEYGRLGSLVIAVPLEKGPRSIRPWVSDLSAEVRNSVRLFGVAPIPASFPPFWDSPEFERSSVARIAATIRNNRRMARVLSAAPSCAGSVSEFQHGLYVTVMPDDDLSAPGASKLAAELCSDLKSAAAPVVHAGSFGFDFVAIEWFSDPVSRRNVLRIAASDAPTSCIDDVAEGITRALSGRLSTTGVASYAMST